MFSAVLIANRGEIAVRIIRTLSALGIRSIAVYTDLDAGALHVRCADSAVLIPSYLDGSAIVAAALSTGAQAVHPGYGFLAENAPFARACADAGLVFIGPPPSAIEAMGDKIRAKQTVAAAGVPVVPGRDEAGLSDAALAVAVAEIGLPVLLKPSAGGGGKGMRLIDSFDQVGEAIASARREALNSFGDDTLLVERYIENPRHIEIQVFGDSFGSIIHLGERECSLQRRHQKIIEEAPSPLLTADQRGAMGASAVAAARAVGYVGAGTVEYIVSATEPGLYYFMEMNTRLQVEHPVTELITGLDLVELQLQVAAGAPLPLTQSAVTLTGHAVEARVYAEDPARGFLPTGGRLLPTVESWRFPHLFFEQCGKRHDSTVRMDLGVEAGDVVGSVYDPMLAKVIAWGADRPSALRRLDRALASYTLLGVQTNISFLRDLLTDPDVIAGDLDTGLVERSLSRGVSRTDSPDGAGNATTHVLVAAGLEWARRLRSGDPDPWAAADGWRLGGTAWTTWRLVVGTQEAVEVRVRGAEVSIGGATPLTVNGHPYATAWDGETLWLGREGRTWTVHEEVRTLSGASGSPGDGGVLRSPMPGTVLAVKVAQGDQVTAGQPVVIVEAMKMEHTVTAPLDGVVTRLPARAGAQVKLDEVLAEISGGA